MNSGMETQHLTAPVPLTILTGFLGAGKTTLLKRILTGDHGLRTAVLVNDFGSINIDAELIVSVDKNVVSLANGCVCCSVGDDLTDAIRSLLESPLPPQYILLEASGVADPAGITIKFSTEAITDSQGLGVRLDSVICVLDAEQFFAASEHMQLKQYQIAAADLLLLNKVDLVDVEAMDKVEGWLSENFRRHRVIKTTECAVPIEVLLASGRFAPGVGGRAQGHAHDACQDEGCTAHHHHHHHSHHHDTTAFKTWSYETRSALSLGALEQVLQKLPVGIYRAKGILNTAENPNQKTIVQVVGKRVSFADGGSWYQDERLSQVVFIAADGKLDEQTLQGQLEQCAACLVFDDDE